ncbi:MAG: DUF4259 domain-containing protein [Anaerolineales bacterium]|nr:DUF4259 domain-containing protein [Anaerolineales bacterium]
MEIWGISSFDNDAAQEWLADFGENDFRLIDRTLAGVAALLPVDELDAVEAAESLVAAECIAAACGVPAASLPDDIQEWLDENSPMQVKSEFVEMARKAAARVLQASDLKDIWEQTEHFGVWETAVSDLQSRLAQIK